ncbi:uncharacterized protein [Dermacentor andersoni]|uniref:uncharacterized protein isoform X1 n=1 Tax=Dermacentor andersoni TaxID=34620 RepID=UPI002417C6A4|nr:uncharacterized protein LOC126522623 isoform X1 [Dermacentor andersoni]
MAYVLLLVYISGRIVNNDLNLIHSQSAPQKARSRRKKELFNEATSRIDTRVSPQVMLTQGSPAKGSGSRLFSSSQSKKCGSYYCEPHQTCEPSFVGPSCTSKRGGNKNPHG